MPRRKQVQNLSQLAARQVSKAIWNFINHHLESKCQFCMKGYLTFSDCPELKDLTELVNKTPVHANLMIHKELSSLALENISTVSIRSCNRLKRKYIQHLVIWLFQSKELGFHVTLIDVEDLALTLRFGKHVNSIEFCYERLSYLRRVLLRATTLLVLNLTLMELTDDTMKIIGKHCKYIRELETFIPIRKYCGMLHSLLFQDSESKLVRNNCCDSLSVVRNKGWVHDIGFVHKGYGIMCEIFCSYKLKKTLEIDALCILLKYVPNLRFVACCSLTGTQLSLILEALELSGMETCQIQAAVCNDGLTLEKLEKIKVMCPKLKVLTDRSAEHDVEVVSSLRMCKNVKKLRIERIRDDSLIYEVMLRYTVNNKWLTLTSLHLSGTLEKLDLSVIAYALDNLEELVVDLVQTEILWDREHTFKSLELIYILQSNFVEDEDSPFSDFDFFQSFSTTIKYLGFQRNRIIRLDQIYSLFCGDSYQNLEVLYLYPLTFDSESIRHIVMNCSKLRSLGSTVITRGDNESRNKDIVECIKYFDEENIDCTFSKELFPISFGY